MTEMRNPLTILFCHLPFPPWQVKDDQVLYEGRWRRFLNVAHDDHEWPGTEGAVIVYESPDDPLPAAKLAMKEARELAAAHALLDGWCVGAGPLVERIKEARFRPADPLLQEWLERQAATREVSIETVVLGMLKNNVLLLAAEPSREAKVEELAHLKERISKHPEQPCPELLARERDLEMELVLGDEDQRKPCTCSSSPSPRSCSGQSNLGPGWRCAEDKP